MANILDTVQISGSSYDLKDKNAPSVSAVTQQEYDNLPSSAKTSNTFFVITDAEAGDLTNYYTKSETNTLLGDKADTATTYTKTEVDNAITAATSTKQDTLVSGTNIKTINNTSLLGSGNIDIQGGGGGKAIEAGRGISITTGATADTVSFSLPISAGTGSNSVAEGDGTTASGIYGSHAEGYRTRATGWGAHAEGNNTQAGGNYSHAEGNQTAANGSQSHAEGFGTIANNLVEHASGQYNVSSKATTTFGDSGNTLFSVGNGTSINARHNAFEIRQNGDIYLTKDGQDVKLQDQLGGGGGGKAIEAGRGISITTGETADTVSFSLPISAGTGSYSIAEGYKTKASGHSSHAEGYNTSAKGNQAHAEGKDTTASGNYSHAEGEGTYAIGHKAHAEGIYTTAYNEAEHASGQFNNSVTASTTFGDSGNTLFSVGNGTANNARHNAFEIRQNGDIYLSSGGTDIKLQDHLGGGGGGSSYSAGTGIDITNDVISVTGKADTSAVTAIQDSLSGYVTTDTEQIISGRKIFTYTNSSNKAIEFKQTDDSSKVGFRVRTSAATNNELASFEFRPNTFTIDNVQHPLLYFGHYRTSNIANAGVPQTVIGFRQYDQLNAAAYHYLIPLPEKAKTPFSLTTTFKDYYAPMGFKNGSTMITADNTGVVDLSSELGGLKLVKLSQSEYDNLSTYDSNTLYVIVN